MNTFKSILFLSAMIWIVTGCAEEENLVQLSNDSFEFKKGKPENGNGSCTNTDFCFQLTGQLQSDRENQVNCVNDRTTQFVMSTSAAEGNLQFYYDISQILPQDCIFEDPYGIPATFALSIMKNNKAQFNSFFNSKLDRSGESYQLSAAGGVITGNWFPLPGETTTIDFTGVFYELKREGKGRSKGDLCATEGYFSNLIIVLTNGACS